VFADENFEVKCELLSERPSFRVEPFNETLARRKSELSAMYEEAPEHLIYSSAVLDRFVSFLQSAPPKTTVAGNVCCAGVGLQLTAKNYYVVPVYVGATLPPGGLPVYRYAEGVREEVLRLDRYGRAGGLFGWDKYRDVVGWVLASFRHNFVEKLMGYVDRPRVPFTGEWVLPNLVLAETVAPSQAVPPASFAFTLLRPALRTTFIVEYSSDTPVTFGFEFWDYAKRDVGRVESFRVDQPGDVRVLITLLRPTLRRSGYFTVDVHDAPHGIVLKSVTSRPMCV